MDGDSKLIVGGQLLAAERQRRIADLVREHGSVRGRMLASQFGVTNETIRRDLMQLEEAGIVDRSHGGAVARGRIETNFDRRLHENEAAKMAIGKAAAALVTNGSTILLDSGSTTIHLARELHDKQDLVVVTSAVTHAAELMENPNITVIMTGGVVRRPTFSTSGELAIATLGELSVDQLFLAINSVSLDKGLMYPHFEEVGVKRAMIAAASEVILLADHSKFNERSLVRVAPISVLSRIVTDTGIDPAIASALRDKDIEVILANPDDIPGESPPDSGP